MLMTQPFTKLHQQRAIVWTQMCMPLSIGTFVTDCHISTMRTLSWDGPNACAISH